MTGNQVGLHGIAKPEAVWRRVGYPTAGAVVEHAHGADNSNVGHAHIGGDQPHGHRHRKVAPGEFEDQFRALSAAEEAAEAFARRYPLLRKAITP